MFRFEKVEIHELTEQRSPTGEPQKKWNKVRDCGMRLVLNAQSLAMTPERKTTYDYVGLTYDKEVAPVVNRIKHKGALYDVIESDSNHRMNKLYLKRVDLHGQSLHDS